MCDEVHLQSAQFGDRRCDDRRAGKPLPPMPAIAGALVSSPAKPYAPESNTGAITSYNQTGHKR